MTEPETIIDSIASDFLVQLVDSDEMITGMMAVTNAQGYMLDVYDIEEARFVSEEKIEFQTEAIYQGKQDENWSFQGDQIRAKISGVAILVDGAWKIEEYEVTQCVTNSP